MSRNPYQHLPPTSFWSSAVTSPVKARRTLAVEPLLSAMSANDTVVSAGSCFSQYIGQELESRNHRYLRSALSDGRVESFGLGNVYSVAQLRQWLEFALGRRSWSEDTVYLDAGGYLDYLLPHRARDCSHIELIEHRQRVAREMIEHLCVADRMIFTVGLTETWRNADDDVLPACPGTLVGQFDASAHRLVNCTCADIASDLEAVEALLVEINPDIRIVLTVSPVPLTATATGEHVLVATSHSKAVIRAAVGQFCRDSARSSYFPSYELISHHSASDWRLEDNLRSVNRSGVRYVMAHAFGQGVPRTDGRSDTEDGCDVNGAPLRRISTAGDAACEEGMLDAYARHVASTASDATIFLVGDSHMQALARGFESLGVETVGGQVMNGSGFSDNRFELNEEGLFASLQDETSQEVWAGILARLRSANGPCRIITNIGFQSHRVISNISNELGAPIFDSSEVAESFERRYPMQIKVLQALTGFGEVWMLEDPNFYTFLSKRSGAEMVRERNFHTYSDYLRKLCRELGVGYLDPCDRVLRHRFKDVGGFGNLVEPDNFHGTPLYYKLCARVIGASINPTYRN